MRTVRLLLLLCAAGAPMTLCPGADTPAAPLTAGEKPTTEGLATMAEKTTATDETTVTDKATMTEEHWCKALTPEQYRVLRQKATEPAFTGEYWKTKTPGTYRCAACGALLFDSEHKFDSGTGWPSFWKPATPDGVETRPDTSHGMNRTEAICPHCGSHLGHVFNDGPDPTGLRYCINSLALKLAEKDSATTNTK